MGAKAMVPILERKLKDAEAERDNFKEMYREMKKQFRRSWAKFVELSYDEQLGQAAKELRALRWENNQLRKELEMLRGRGDEANREAV